MAQSRSFEEPHEPDNGALVALPHGSSSGNADAEYPNDPTWLTILSDSHQVVLYNSDSHALSVQPHGTVPASLRNCPYCHRPLVSASEAAGTNGLPYAEHDQHTRASNYFQLLEVANETSSRPASGRNSRMGQRADPEEGVAEANGRTFRSNAMAEGYFSAFFKEENRLGMGGNGSVFLCQHVLDGNPLGYFAVKKIAIGQSHAYLGQILREVRLLERLRHPNIITYHHSWLETYQFSSFGPKVPTLFVLMQWAEGGSLDDFIDARLGHPHVAVQEDAGQPKAENEQSREERIRAFRAALAQPPSERERMRAERARGVRTAVHLLSPEETKRLFTDIVSGLAFLHDQSILHLDLKPGNVLLTWREGSLIPRAMLSDFGTSRDSFHPSRPRTGNTGTLEYCAPESLPSPQTGMLSQVDSKADMWSLGMILHMLLFFRVPYHYSSDGDMRGSKYGDLGQLEREVQEYTGFKRTTGIATVLGSRGLPLSYVLLLESLLNRTPTKRPSSEQVLRAIREGNLDPLPMDIGASYGEGTLVYRVPTASHYTNTAGSIVESAGSSIMDDEGSIVTAESLSAMDSDSKVEPEQDLLGGQESRTGTLTTQSPKAMVPLLALPPTQPIDTLSTMRGRIEQVLQRLFFSDADCRTWSILYRPFLTRFLKSLLLIIKVLSLISLCPEGHPEPAFTSFVMALAMSDLWTDDLWFMVFLAIVHVIILRTYCVKSSCCV